MNNRKLILYISMSLDGYLAGPNDDLSFLDSFMIEGEDYGYNDFTSSIDTYIVGKRTYDVVMGLIGKFPQADQYDCYVITRQKIERSDNVTFYNGDLTELIAKIREKDGKNIYCDGGAQIVRLLLKKELIDEMIISVMPVMLGGGTRLFLDGSIPAKLELKGTKEYSAGVVQLRYSIRKV